MADPTRSSYAGLETAMPKSSKKALGSLRSKLRLSSHSHGRSGAKKSQQSDRERTPNDARQPDGEQNSSPARNGIEADYTPPSIRNESISQRANSNSVPRISFERQAGSINSASSKMYSGSTSIPRTPTHFAEHGRRQDSQSDSPDSRSWQTNSSPLNQPRQFDPSHIVQMALNLSDSRRYRSTSSHHLTALSQSSKQTPYQTPEKTQNLLNHNVRTHLPAVDTISGLRKSSQLDQHPVDTLLALGLDSSREEHVISPATKVRAERARDFFELSAEYRRLLQYLPPLQPSSENQPRSLGRPYNPLQFVRNRRLRIRVRQTLDSDSAGRENIINVREWVNQVAERSQSPGFIVGNEVNLPPLRSPPGMENETSGTIDNSIENDGIGRDAEKVSRPKRPRLDWTIEPSELLADAFWVEKDGNKTLIETSSGHKIFQNVPRSPIARRAAASRVGQRTGNDSTARQVQTYQTLPGNKKRANSEDLSESEDELFPASSNYESRTNRMKRHLLRRPRTQDLEDSSNSSESGTKRKRRQLKSANSNYGALERHIDKMLKTESRAPVEWDDLETPLQDIDHHPRRFGVSEETTSPQARESLEAQGGYFGKQIFDTLAPSLRPDKRPSSEDINEKKQDVDVSQGDHATIDHDRKGHKLRKFALNRRSRGKSLLADEIPPEAAQELGAVQDQETQASIAEQLPHFESTRGSNRFTPWTSQKKTSRVNNRGHSPTPSASHRFFKGGRIGELVRDELPHTNEHIVLKQRAPNSPLRSQHAEDSHDVSATGYEHSNDSDLRAPQLDALGGGNDRYLNVPSTDPGDDSQLNGSPRYHTKNLPSFTSTSQSQSTSGQDSMDPLNSDHITRQSRERSLLQRSSRLENLRPPSIDTHDVSPRSTSLDLTRTQIRESGVQGPTSRSAQRGNFSRSASSFSKGARNPGNRTTNGVKEADRRLNTLLSSPGGVGKAGPPPTALTDFSVADPGPDYGGRGSISYTTSTRRTRISSKDVIRIRAQLLTSGVKARWMAEAANAPRPKIPSFVLKAIETAEKSTKDIPEFLPRRHEHVMAAQMLSSHLSSTSITLQRLVRSFRETTYSNLHDRSHNLREMAQQSLIPKVRASGDTADEFIARLTTERTLDVKRMNDAVDLLMRQRRQRLRKLSLVGFTILEWTLVGLLWIIWGIVSAIRMVRTLIMGALNFTGWLLWIF